MIRLPFLAIFRRTPLKPPTVSQKGIQARAIRHLICHGSITASDVLDMGTNDATKMFSRLRTLGLLYAADDLNGFRWVDNRSGHGKHKRHYWTRRMPPDWVKPPKTERRKPPRKR